MGVLKRMERKDRTSRNFGKWDFATGALGIKKVLIRCVWKMKDSKEEKVTTTKLATLQC